jgi:LPXTG-motif cell wall-anchored protein
MKKLIVFAMVLMLCATMVLPVCAQEQEFVPSITYKDGLVVTEATMNGEDVSACIEVTSIKEAKEKTTDITQEARDELLEVYEKLSNGTLKLPLEGDYVVLELVDISFAQKACVETTDHEHAAWLAKENNTVTIDLGHMGKNFELKVFCYNDGQWVEIENVVNNGDGTFTCEFEHFCPVAFCVEGDALEQGPVTGDNSNLILWLGIMLAAAAGLVTVLAVNRRRAA